MENKLYLIEPEADDVSAIYKGNSCFAVYGASLYFRIGDEDDEEEGSWRDDTVTHPVQVAIEYFDKGTEDIVVGYTRTGSSETTETVVTKGNTLKWKTVYYTLAHEAMIGSAYYIDNGLADLRLYSDGVLYISLLNITETTLQVDAQETANGKSREFSKTIASDNFVSGSAGWRITREGNAEFNNVTVRGTIYATLGEIGGFDIGSDTITADSGAFTFNSTTPSILMGAATNYTTGAGLFIGKVGSYYNFRIGDPSGSYMNFNGTTGVLSIVGASVTIGAGTDVGGWTIAVTPDRLINDTGVDATSAGMSPSDYPFYAGAQYANRTSAPFRVNPAGEIWATKATITGAMVFQKSMVSAFAGQQIIATSASVLTADATGGASFSISVKGQGGAAPFASGDHIRITNTDGTATWGTVGSPSGSDPYTYTVTRTVGSGTPSYVTGNTVVDYGASGSGYIVLAAEGSNTPQISINTWTTNPSSGTITERVRIGNLSGLSMDGSSSLGYGIYTTNGYFTGTIVGSTIKTATSNQRVELTSNYLNGYNAAGTSVFGFALVDSQTIGGASRDIGDFVVGTGGELFYDASAGVLNLKGLAVQMLSVGGTGNIQLDPQGYAFVRLSSNGKKTITGIKPTTNANGQLLVIKHDGTGKLVLKRNTTSGAYMPINTQSSKDITIDGYGNALLQYDSVNNGWTVIAFRSKGVNNGGVTASAQTSEGSYDEVVNIIAPLSEGAINGKLIIGRAGATIAEDMVVPGSGTWSAVFATPADGAYSFSSGDIVYVKSGASVTWFTVVQNTLDDDFQTYTATYESGTRPETYESGLDVTSYGQSGQGFLLLSASDSGAPFISVRAHAGAPWTTQTEYVRMGNLDGNWGYSGATYGFAVGEYGSNKPNITIDPTNGLRIRHNTTNVITLDTSGNASIAGAMTIGASLSIGTSGNIKSGATAYNTGTGFFLEYNAGTPRFFIGAAAGNKLTWDGSALSITGSITATTGTIGGWTINSTTIDGTDATLDSTGVLTLGTTTNVVILSAVDATYRLWIGHSTAGSAPFRVSKAGAVTATSGTVGGWTLGSSSLTGGNAVLANTGILTLGTGTDVAIVDASDATYRLVIGHSTYGSAPFRVSKAGAVTATSGTVGGWTLASTSFTGGNATLHSTGYLLLGTGTDIVRADATDSTYRLWVGHSTVGSAPFRVTKAGEVTASNITATGQITTTVFVKSATSAFAGSFMVAKSASVLDSDATATGSTFSISVKAQAAAAPFASGDHILFTDGTNSTYATVGASSGTGPYTYTATYTSGSNSATYAAGTTVIDMGSSGSAYLYVTSDDSEGPFYSVRSWVTNPYTGANVTEHVRLGNMKGVFGSGGSSYYGIGIGDYANGNYMMYNTNTGLRIRGTTSAASIALGATPPTSSSSGTGVYIDYTGIYGLNDNTQQAYIKASDGSFLAGQGIARIDDTGLWMGGGATGWKTGGTYASDSSVGTTAWTSPSNASASDNAYATTFVENGVDALSEMLKVTNLGFDIPSGATIVGVVVQVEFKRNSTTSTVALNAQLYKAGSLVGSQIPLQMFNDGTYGTDTVYTYGGANNLWGTTLSESDVEDSGFGVGIQAEEAGVGIELFSVDYVRVKVYYTTIVSGSTLIFMNDNYIDKAKFSNGIEVTGGGSVSGTWAMAAATATSVAISHTAPTLTLSDTTSSAKDLRLTVDANKAVWSEYSGTVDFMTWDLANLRFRFGDSTAPTYQFEVAGTAPVFAMIDTTGSAKSLKVTTDSNLTKFEETGGAAANLLVLDLANARVGIGNASPSVPLHVKTSATANGLIVEYNGTSGSGIAQSFGYFFVNDGAAMASLDRLGGVAFGGAYDASNNHSIQAEIFARATQAWTSGARGSRMEFYTTANGATAETLALTLHQDQSAVFAAGATFAGTIINSGNIQLTGGYKSLRFEGGSVDEFTIYHNYATALEFNDATFGVVMSIARTTGIVTIGAGLTMADGKNIVLNTSTGTKIGTSTTQKLGFYNATPIVRPSAYTQTYSTADKTHATPTAATLTDNSGGTANTTLQSISAAYTQAEVRNNFADLAAMVNKNTADHLDLAQLVNSLIDDLQALGFVG